MLLQINLSKLILKAIISIAAIKKTAPAKN